MTIIINNHTQIDDSRLGNLLAKEQWLAANEETAYLLLQIANRVGAGFLRVEDIDKLPCDDLRIINRLWQHYSLGRWGFSVQKNIYQSLGGTRKYHHQIWQTFDETVGWQINKNYREWIDRKNLDNVVLKSLPLGHLPLFFLARVLFSRLERCGL
jgi:hypothetical protein